MMWQWVSLFVHIAPLPTDPMIFGEPADPTVRAY